MQTNLLVLKSIPIIENRPPIYAVQMADGQFGATLLSLCALLDIDKGRQVARIKRNPMLAEALVLMEVKTQGGRQSADVLMPGLSPFGQPGCIFRDYLKKSNQLPLSYSEKSLLLFKKRLLSQAITRAHLSLLLPFNLLPSKLFGRVGMR
jgi:hypothetical protein